MKVDKNLITLILSYVLCLKQGVSAVEVGDDVCITGYVNDNFCIQLGTLLDKSFIKTLEHQEEHSFHCLLDVDSCIEGGYQVLGQKTRHTGMQGLGFHLNDMNTVVIMGQSCVQNGYCMSCTGNSSAPEYVWLATVNGTVTELGDGSSGISGSPILDNVQLFSSDVEFNVTTVPPLCVESLQPRQLPFQAPPLPLLARHPLDQGG